MAQQGRVRLDWARHEDEIKDLFVSEEKTWKEVQAYMKEKHNFEATERQFKSRFSKLKNVRGEEWLWIDQEIEYRATLGKQSVACLHAKRLPSERVSREIARHRNKRFINPSPGRISVRTPPPIHSIPARLERCPSAAGVISGESSAYLRASTSQQTDSPATFPGGAVSELFTSMDIDPLALLPDIDQRLSSPDLSHERTFNTSYSLNFDFDFDFHINGSRGNTLSPTTVARQMPIFRGSNSPRPLDMNCGLSPFSEFLNLEVLDVRPDFQMMSNLPYFKLQYMLDQPENSLLRLNRPILEPQLSPTSPTIITLVKGRQDIILRILGSNSELQRMDLVAQVTSKLQRVMPERYEAELSKKASQFLNEHSSGASDLTLIFELAAYYASNNWGSGMDAFLKWVIEQKYLDYLQHFLQIKTPTIQIFTACIQKSAIGMADINLLSALLDHGVKFDNVLDDLCDIEDMVFINRVFSSVKSNDVHGTRGVALFHSLIRREHLEAARRLIDLGVSVDCRDRFHLTALLNEVSRKNIRTIKFLLDLGADPTTALSKAVSLKNAVIVGLLMSHGALTSCTIDGREILEWCSLNCRDIYHLLRETSRSITAGITLGDLVEAAGGGIHSMQAFMRQHGAQFSMHQLEDALSESIRLKRLAAAVALLQYGVSPDCYTLKERPLSTAVSTHEYQFCELLLKYKANPNVPGILHRAISREDIEILELLYRWGLNLDQQGAESLVACVYKDLAQSAEFLLDCGVDINTPGPVLNPLQAAAVEDDLDWIEFLLARGADINAPAHPYDGLTTLQAALRSHHPTLVADYLLTNGADIHAPPALVNGVTALEAIAQGCGFDEECISLWSRLLDAGAQVIRPDGNPSSALHGAIARGWEEIVSQILEPDRNAIISYMWCDRSCEEEYGYLWEPRTPTQLAAGKGNLTVVKMLLERGADVNEAPHCRFGRTALQAATSSDCPDLELVRFLLEKGANIHARPAVHGGITALQGAAISGNIILVKLLLDEGAEVNAMPAMQAGRYAIEGAAEHGRLDTVQLLLNAGAKGNVLHGKGLKYAIRLAEENGHHVIATMLREHLN